MTTTLTFMPIMVTTSTFPVTVKCYYLTSAIQVFPHPHQDQDSNLAAVSPNSILCQLRIFDKVSLKYTGIFFINIVSNYGEWLYSPTQVTQSGGEVTYVMVPIQIFPMFLATFCTTYQGMSDVLCCFRDNGMNLLHVNHPWKLTEPHVAL